MSLKAKILAAALAMPVAACALIPAPGGFYGKPTTAALTSMGVASPASEWFTLHNISGYTLWFEIEGATGTIPVELYPNGDSRGRDWYTPSYPGATVASWVYYDQAFTNPALSSETLYPPQPTVCPGQYCVAAANPPAPGITELDVPQIN